MIQYILNFFNSWATDCIGVNFLCCLATRFLFKNNSFDVDITVDQFYYIFIIILFAEIRFDFILILNKFL